MKHGNEGTRGNMPLPAGYPCRQRSTFSFVEDGGMAKSKDTKKMCPFAGRKIPADKGAFQIAVGRTNRRTQAESQWIVALGYSQHLQYLDAIKSSAKDLSLAIFEITIGHHAFSGGGAHTKLAEAIISHVILQAVDNRA